MEAVCLHSVIVIMRDSKDHIRVLLYSYCTAVTGWEVLLKYAKEQEKKRVAAVTTRSASKIGATD